MKTHTPKSPASKERKWYLVDAKDQILGRLAADIAILLRGKNKLDFTPHFDMGDYVIVINAEQIRLTGSKEEQKEYISHSGHLGHIKRKPYQKAKEADSTQILSKAVAGMIPNNRLKKFILKKLNVYSGSQHPHAGQNPIIFNAK